MALAGALQVNTMLEELDLGETDQVSTCTFSGVEVVLYECLVGRVGAQGGVLWNSGDREDRIGGKVKT